MTSLTEADRCLERALGILKACERPPDSNAFVITEDNYEEVVCNLGQCAAILKVYIQTEVISNEYTDDEDKFDVDDNDADSEEYEPAKKRTRRSSFVKRGGGEPRSLRAALNKTKGVESPLYPLHVSAELRSLLSWLNSLPSCYRKSDKPLPSDFDVLRGKSYKNYGLHSTGAWRQHLAILLMKWPNFRHANFLFFGQIFRQTADIWRKKISAFEKLFKKEPVVGHQFKYVCREKSFVAAVLEPAIHDKIDFGPALEKNADGKDWMEGNTSTFQVTPSQPVKEDAAAVDHSNRMQFKKMINAFVRSDKDAAVENGEAAAKDEKNTYADVLPGALVAKVHKTFGTMHFYGYNVKVLPVLKSEHCVALLGVHVSNEGVCRGRVLVRHNESPLSRPEDELSNLIQVLLYAFGMPRKAVYKWREMIPPGEKFQYRTALRKKEKDEILALDASERVVKLEEAVAAFKPDEEMHEHNQVAEYSAGVAEQQEIEIVEDLDLRLVNNLSILLGGDNAELYSVKTLFNGETHQKFLDEVDTCKTSTAQKLSHSQFCKTVLEVYKFLTGLAANELVSRFPETFGNDFKQIRLMWNRIEDLTNVQAKTSKQCNYCGKVFECHTTTMDGQNITNHIKKCKLEQANCDCGLNFASPREKRRHMLVSHSGKKYLECSFCHFVTQVQSALDNHVEYFHGHPGTEEMCDLCFKNFRSRYYLSIHRFTHECHYCHTCGREFMGRLPFRNHMKNEHGAGFPCDVCGKVIITKVELEKHKKLNHADKSWMTT
jgi:hypothetical protein